MRNQSAVRNLPRLVPRPCVELSCPVSLYLDSHGAGDSPACVLRVACFLRTDRSAPAGPEQRDVEIAANIQFRTWFSVLN